MGVFFITKYVNSCTLELWLSYVFMYGKLGFIMLFSLADMRIACWYTFFCVCLWLMLQPPRFTETLKLTKPKTAFELD
jgi:hypothetical protein